jgi:UDP-GlcNAc:undecaprenyl-phosphate GlcNAc-1-phosphate transferase
MGDCGSLTVGFLLGWFGIVWSQKSVTSIGMTAPLIAFAIPFLDTALAIARRSLRGQPLFEADRAHMHHRLLARGFTTRRVAYLLYAFAGILAGLSLLLSSAGIRLGGLVLVAFCIIVWIAVQYLGYEEFDTARQMIFGHLFRRILNRNLAIRKLERIVQSAGSIDECWTALVATSRSFEFSETTLQFRNCCLNTQLAAIDFAQCWDILIPLNHSGHVHFRVPFQAAQVPDTIGRLATAVGETLADKLSACYAHPANRPIDITEEPSTSPSPVQARVSRV